MNLILSLHYFTVWFSVPNGYPQNFEARAVSSRMFTLTWYPPNFEDRNGIIIGYTINLTNTRRNDTLLYSSNTTALTLSTLSPYTTYYCTVAARTSIGTGPFTAVLTLLTPQDGKKLYFPIVEHCTPLYYFFYSSSI